MKQYKPPFTFTPNIIHLCEEISYEIGRLEGEKMTHPPLRLRRDNKIKTIHASLAIEGNTLSLDQITSLMEGKRVFGPSKDILEIKNALSLYSEIRQFNPFSVDDLLKAHGILMDGLIEPLGQFRASDVGIFKGEKVAHMAPPAKRIQTLMVDLFGFVEFSKDFSLLVKSCIFHYEFEFIHPFMDGNGRMGRLWQQLLLMKHHPIFEYIALEELVKEQQSGYYEALGQSDEAGESTKFVGFMLDIILKTLARYHTQKFVRPQDATSRLVYASSLLTDKWFSRKDYLGVFPDISTSTASRDLLFGVGSGILSQKGDHNQIMYQFIGLE